MLSEKKLSPLPIGQSLHPGNKHRNVNQMLIRLGNVSPYSFKDNALLKSRNFKNDITNDKWNTLKSNFLSEQLKINS